MVANLQTKSRSLSIPLPLAETARICRGDMLRVVDDLNFEARALESSQEVATIYTHSKWLSKPPTALFGVIDSRILIGDTQALVQRY